MWMGIGRQTGWKEREEERREEKSTRGIWWLPGRYDL